MTASVSDTAGRRLVDSPVASEFFGGISLGKLWAMKTAGEIPHVKCGRRILFDVRDLEMWIERNKEGGAR